MRCFVFNVPPTAKVIIKTGPRLKVAYDRLVKPKIEPATLGLQGKQFIHYTTAAQKTGLSHPVKYFTDPSNAVLLLWIFHVFFYLVFVMPLYASVYLCLVVTCWERADLLGLTVCLSLSHWYHGSGVVLDSIYS